MSGYTLTSICHVIEIKKQDANLSQPHFDGENKAGLGQLSEHIYTYHTWSSRQVD